ncbi:MAG: adenylate kinase family protein, partial [Actinomycetota bacterium]
TNEVVGERLRRPDAETGFILDGYPRNLAQAEALDRMLAELGVEIDAVLRFMVTGPEIVARLSGRRICPACKAVYHLATSPPRERGVCDQDGTGLVQREDDREETVLRRLEVYGERTKPLLDLYARRGLLVDVDAIGSESEVFGRLLTAVLGASAQ